MELAGVIVFLMLIQVGLLWLGRENAPAQNDPDDADSRPKPPLPPFPDSSALRQLVEHHPLVRLATWDVNPPLFEIRDLTKTYTTGTGSLDALRGVNLKIAGGSLAITGPNGSGKSTLMNILGALDVPTSGCVMYRGEEIRFEDARAMNDFRARIPAFILQDLNLFADQTALENVAFSLTRYGESYRFALEAAQEMLDELGIDSATSQRFPNELSGGQRQRVAIARALLANSHGGAEVILADEPTAAVDSMDSERVFRLLLEQAHARSVPVLVVTHNPQLARLADRVLICEHGLVREAESETLA